MGRNSSERAQNSRHIGRRSVFKAIWLGRATVVRGDNPAEFLLAPDGTLGSRRIRYAKFGYTHLMNDFSLRSAKMSVGHRGSSGSLLVFRKKLRVANSTCDAYLPSVALAMTIRALKTGNLPERQV